jgi:hypothetical protein
LSFLLLSTSSLAMHRSDLIRSDTRSNLSQGCRRKKQEPWRCRIDERLRHCQSKLKRLWAKTQGAVVRAQDDLCRPFVIPADQRQRTASPGIRRHGTGSTPRTVRKTNRRTVSSR